MYYFSFLNKWDGKFDEGVLRGGILNRMCLAKKIVSFLDLYIYIYGKVVSRWRFYLVKGHYPVMR